MTKALQTDLGMRLIQPYQVNKEILLNTNLLTLEAWINSGIESRSKKEAPDGPEFGQKYIIPEGHDESWAGGGEGEIAIFLDAWRFVKPKGGTLLWIKDEEKLIVKAKDGLWKELY